MPSAAQPLRRRPTLQCILLNGTLASAVSALALAWRGRREKRTALGTLNAPAHWLWGEESLHQRAATLRHTLGGMLVHHASSLFWAVFYEVLRVRRAAPTPANALADAAAVGTVAAVVDLRLTPRRFTPGFEHHLSRTGLTWVYVGFVLGLALAECTRRR